MKTLRKIVNVVSWIIIVMIGCMMLYKWNEIGQQVKAHSNLTGGFSMGDKSILVAIYMIYQSQSNYVKTMHLYYRISSIFSYR